MCVYRGVYVYEGEILPRAHHTGFLSLVFIANVVSYTRNTARELFSVYI